MSTALSVFEQWWTRNKHSFSHLLLSQHDLFALLLLLLLLPLLLLLLLSQHDIFTLLLLLNTLALNVLSESLVSDDVTLPATGSIQRYFSNSIN